MESNYTVTLEVNSNFIHYDSMPVLIFMNMFTITTDNFKAAAHTVLPIANLIAYTHTSHG